MDHIEPLVEVLLEFCFGRYLGLEGFAVEHEMEGIVVSILRIYAVGCKAPAQAVAPHMHVGNSLHDPGSVKAFTILVHCPEDGASADLLIVKLSSLPWHSNQKLQTSTLQLFL